MTWKRVHKLDEILKEMLGPEAARKEQRADRSKAIWEEVVGPDIAPHARFERIEQAVLYVAVDSAPLLSDLSQFMREELLEGLAKAGLRVKEVRFRLE